MKVPFSWLREYVAWQGSVEEVAELLTMSGTEVEAVTWVGAPRDRGNLERFVVGRVLTRERHPNADKLSLCNVEVGERHGGVRQIVCGADNFQAGDTVAVSLTGAVLESGLKLRRTAIRGIESDGMMLSEQELGYEVQSPGIAILPPGLPVGAPLQEYLPVSEAVLELELTSNRPDCFSIYGIAREVSAAGGVELYPPPIADAAVFGGAPAAEAIAVEVADPDLCPRYAARVIRGVRVGESPAWLKARLTHAGMRPIDNVVDVTNYVMLGWGQPLHAFDAGKIRGRTLVVRRATAGERIVTLDGVERALDEQMLVIADVERPLVIAGVFGSLEAEIDAATRDVVLEAATFAGPSILRTEMHTGIRSEASNRFEKGLDPELVPGALSFASRLFVELCDGTVAPGVVDRDTQRPSRPRLRYRPKACDALLGYAVPPAEQATILKRLECAVEVGEEWGVTPPSFRPDLEREVDLIEEVGRIAGYQLAPETLPRHTTAGGLTKPQQVRRAVRRVLAGCGLDEVVTYTFVAPDALAPLGLPEGDERLRPVRISNPMSVEQSVMRTMLLPGLLGAVRANIDRLNDPPSLFEIGRVYLWDEPSPAPPHAAEPGAVLPHETEVVGMVLCGPLVAESWIEPVRRPDFFTLKGVVEATLAAVGLRGEFRPLAGGPEQPVALEQKGPVPWRGRFPYLHPGKSAAVSVPGAGAIGVLGQLRPDVAAAYGLEGLEVYVATLTSGFVSLALPTAPFSDLGAYPPAAQDLAVVVPADIAFADVLAVARKAGGRLLQDVSLFDVYEGGQVPEGKRSLALRLEMRSAERTLSDKDITTVRRKVLAALERQYGATLR